MDYTYRQDFKYTHHNPYHHKLADFSDLVMRDELSELFKGKWNELLFKRESPLFLEIGSGYGDFMEFFCTKHQDSNFVGMDYRFKRTFELAKKFSKISLNNFKYLRARGERISFIFNDNEVDHIFYFFPDPWPKTRHNKKRLFQQTFLESALKVLKPGGRIYIKTDHDHYAEWIKREINLNNDFKLLFETKDLKNEFPTHFLASFETKFEKIFISKGIKIKAFVIESQKALKSLSETNLKAYDFERINTANQLQ